MGKFLLILMCGIFTVIGFPNTLNAFLIDLSAFSGNETLIDFSTPFERTSSPINYQGVTFRVVNWWEPVSNTDLAANGDWGYFFRNIPGVSGGYAMNDFIGNTQLRIEFATNVNRVGLLLSTGAVTSWTMVAWDRDGIFIEARNARMPAENNAVFLGLETLSNIAFVDIIESNNGLATLFDDIRFESTTPVPVPSTILLLGSGLIGLIGFRRKFRK